MSAMPSRIRIGPYCVLCRGSLKHLGRHPRITVPTYEDYARRSETEVLCFFWLKQAHQESHNGIHIFRADLRYQGWENADESLNQVMNAESLRFDFSSKDGDWDKPEKVAHFVHTSCLQLAIQRCGQFSLPDLYYITLKTKPILAWSTGSTAKTFTEIDTPLSSLLGDYSHDTSLGQLVFKIETRLPAELRRIIYGQSSGIFRSLLVCSQALHGYEHKTRCIDSSITASYPFLGCYPIKKIGVNTVDIFGESYLSAIGARVDLDWDKEIWLADHQVQGVQVSMGLYGVVALRILYTDGSTSVWLGRSAQRWVTIYNGHDLKLLQAFSDGIKLIALTLSAEDGKSSEKEEVDRVRGFWNSNATFSASMRHVLIDVWKAPRITANPNARFLEYLDLKENDVQCITVNFSSEGLSSIQVNGNAQRKIGHCRQDVSLTYFLSPGEYIKAAYVVVQASLIYFKGLRPFLLLVTSEKRVLFYCPHPRPFASAPTEILSFDVKNNERVVGIFINPTSTVKSGHGSIGVALEHDHQISRYDSYNVSNIDTERTCGFPHRGTFRELKFLNKARLIDVHQLHLQRDSDRCVGLRIDHYDGTVEVLGQWDPADTEAISLLYNSSDGPLSALLFEFSVPDSAALRYVKSIHICAADVEACPDTGFIWKDLSSELTWGFTRKFDYVVAGEDCPMELVPRRTDLLFVDLS